MWDVLHVFDTIPRLRSSEEPRDLRRFVRYNHIKCNDLSVSLIIDSCDGEPPLCDGR